MIFKEIKVEDGEDDNGRTKYKKTKIDRAYFNTFFNEKVEVVAEGGMGNPTLENGETEYPFEVTLPSEKDGAETSFNYCFGSFNLTGNEHGNII